ncbi:MAG TPA: cation diffusion facilitator family transporter [Vicinamibacterales bacterium]|nr:cation diffusion facilitator family transporter [Vicinamibacterales bacterium]
MGLPDLRRYAWLSIAAAVATITLKTLAYVLTGSVGLLSDAVESIVNLAGAVVALAMLIVAARPADEEHAYGHSKAEYFSSGAEGALILFAAGGIAVAAARRLLTPQPIEQVGLGLAVSAAATAVNLAVALVLRRAAARHASITLDADSKHLLTDVWTSAGVIAGVFAVSATGWLALDPILALAVALLVIGLKQVLGAAGRLPAADGSLRQVLQTGLDTCHLLGGATVPVSAVVCGCRMASIRPHHVWTRLMGGTVLLRLAVVPALSVIVLKLLPISGLPMDVLMVIAVQPAAMVSVTLAELYDRDPPFAAAVVFVTHLVCLATIPLWLHLVLGQPGAG